MGEEPGPLSQRLERADQRTARVGGGVEHREACGGRWRVGDPRLMATVKGDRREPCRRVADDGFLHGAVGQKRIAGVTHGVAARRSSSTAPAIPGAPSAPAAPTAAAPVRVRNWRRSRLIRTTNDPKGWVDVLLERDGT